MSDPDLRHARIRITLTPPLTMVAQDADAAGISLAALLSADVHRGRYLALYPNLQAYVQGDPRGAALYVLRPGDVPKGESPESYYSRGLAIYR